MKVLFVCLLIFACSNDRSSSIKNVEPAIESKNLESQPDLESKTSINTKDVKPKQLVSFAKTLKGTPYKYASTDPDIGFDCSGFITYVFNHFDISVPRSSRDFSNVGKEVNINVSKAGDLILFTGTNPNNPEIGHMGIITQNQDSIEFIHSTSGKAYGVTITPYNVHYQKRFVKVIRIF